AAESWEKFSVEIDKHLSNFEEGILFPAFEEVGGPMGPIMVMRQEHQQMRAVVEQMDAALKAENDGDFLGLSETFMVLTQQHNMKEEQILYPMMDSNLPGAEALLEELKSQ
ncbi:MAG: hemerythrin domain-containing protein, partial [Spirochaetota bacterium]|nr:hemerythrin domain-containing protein [Spirochaetota bacterium]